MLWSTWVGFDSGGCGFFVRLLGWARAGCGVRWEWSTLDGTVISACGYARATAVGRTCAAHDVGFVSGIPALFAGNCCCGTCAHNVGSYLSDTVALAFAASGLDPGDVPHIPRQTAWPMRVFVGLGVRWVCGGYHPQAVWVVVFGVAWAGLWGGWVVCAYVCDIML